MFTLKFFEYIDLVFKNHFDFRFFEALQFEGDGFIILFVFGFDYFTEAALAEEFLDFVVGLEEGVLAEGGQGIGGSLLFHLDYIIMEDYLVIIFSIFGGLGLVIEKMAERVEGDVFLILTLSFQYIFFRIFIIMIKSCKYSFKNNHDKVIKHPQNYL